MILTEQYRLQSFIERIGDLDLAVAFHREEKVVIFISQIHHCIVVFACDTEVVFLQEKVNHLINHQCPHVIVLNSFTLA